jgi:hypothetical protein
MLDLAARVRQMQGVFPAYAKLLQCAYDYIPEDAAGSLTKSRTVIELVVMELYVAEMGKEPKKRDLGAILTDNQFTRKLDDRILGRMDGVRRMGNAGTHGRRVEAGDAQRALDDVCEVLIWYRHRRAGDEPANGHAAAGGAVPGTDPLPAARGDQDPGVGGVMVAADTARIELHINADFDSFTPEQQERVLRAIRDLLSAGEDIRVVNKRRGSVRLTVALTPEQAEELLWAVKGGRLEEFGVVDAELVEHRTPEMSTLDWRRLQEVADRYHQARKQGVAAELEPFLPPPGDPQRRVVLHELIATDLELRWEQRQGVGLEYYLEKYPELGSAPELPAKLIHEEYRVRRRCGDRPTLASYQTRFPDQYEELGRLVESATDAATPSGAARPTILISVGKAGEGVLPRGYRALERIGSGAFGEVWRAEAPGGFLVAVKVIFGALGQEEAKRELAALDVIRQLRHPCLVMTTAYFAEQDRLYIVTELGEGSLRDRLEECRRVGLQGIPQDELLLYVRDAAEGLDYLHGHHVTHRDVKPENILLMQGHAKLADFGLAREQRGKGSSSTLAGTPLYLAPELFRGTADPRSDQYSLAMAYAELRLGRRLLHGVNLVELMLEHLEKTPDLSGLPDAEQRVILKALSKEPEDRYPSCLALVRALEQAATALPRFVAAAGAPAHPTGKTSPQAHIAPPAPPGQWPAMPPGTGGRASETKLPRGTVPAAVSGWHSARSAPAAKAPDWRPPGRRNWGWLVVLLLAVLAVLMAVLVYKVAF